MKIKRICHALGALILITLLWGLLIANAIDADIYYKARVASNLIEKCRLQPDPETKDLISVRPTNQPTNDSAGHSLIWVDQSQALHCPMHISVYKYFSLYTKCCTFLTDFACVETFSHASRQMGTS